MNENTSAGPAPWRITSPFAPICPAAAVPMAPKIPAPMTAPIASMMRSPAPMTRFQRVLRVGQELRDWLAPEQLIHRNGF